jgi:YVTN family beta-propeller protein
LTGQFIALPNNSALVYDPTGQKLYVAVRGSPGAVVPIDPSTGTVGTSITVGIDPAKLALSAGGEYLYVALNGEALVQRVNIATQAVDLSFGLGSDSFFGQFFAEDIAVIPGSPQSIAVSLKNQGISPRHAGVAIFDGAVRRANMTARHTGSNVIEFSASAGTLYGYNNETTEFGFRRMVVDASGVVVQDVHDSFHPSGALISGFGVDIKFHNGLIYSTTGRVVDPITRTLVGSLSPLPGFGGSIEPDTANTRVFTLVYDGSVGAPVIRAYDPATLMSLGAESVSGVSGDAANLVRWGTRGLAFRTSGGQVFVSASTSLLP